MSNVDIVVLNGYWVETMSGRSYFLDGATGWEILVDGKLIQFHKGSAAESIISTFVLRNVIRWYYGEKRKN